MFFLPFLLIISKAFPTLLRLLYRFFLLQKVVHHPQYSDFNIFELEFARELDSRNVLWMRNPANGFLKIPLLDGKGTDTFNPDFIVWTENEILALDTKGSHLIAEDSNRKLFYIEKVCEGKELTIRLVSEKKYNERQEVIDTSGFTSNADIRRLFTVIYATQY